MTWLSIENVILKDLTPRASLTPLIPGVCIYIGTALNCFFTKNQRIIIK
jgi:hypothetical protein